MKISVQNIVRSPFFLSLPLGVSIYIEERFLPISTWFGNGPLTPLLRISEGYGIPDIAVIAVYGSIDLLPLYFLWWYIFRRPGYNKPALLSFIALFGTWFLYIQLSFAFLALWSNPAFSFFKNYIAIFLIGGLVTFLASKVLGRKVRINR